MSLCTVWLVWHVTNCSVAIFSDTVNVIIVNKSKNCMMGINSFSFYHLYHFRNLGHILVCWWWQHFDDNVDSVFM